MRILITGSAGFIGFHLSQLFLKNNHDVIGIDNMCQSYGVEYKVKRLNILKKNRKFKFYKIDVGNIFNEAGFVIVGKINLGSNLLIAKNSFINFELLRQE